MDRFTHNHLRNLSRARLMYEIDSHPEYQRGCGANSTAAGAGKPAHRGARASKCS